jgi:tetratricopeptide (TPR) repeat protein
MGKAIAATRRLVFIAVVGLFVLGKFAAATDDYLDYYERGEFSLATERWDRAIEYFTRAIQDNPSFFRAYHARAIAYSKTGEYDLSIADLKKAVALNPDYPDAYGLMGLVYEMQKDYAAALKIYEKAMDRERRPAMRKMIERYIEEAKAKLKAKQP